MLGGSPLRDVFDQIAAARQKLAGTPIKTVTTTTLPTAVPVAGAAAPTPLNIVQTTLLYGFREGDVDEKEFAIPAGYTRAGRPGGQ
jgi:hypothetical protein